MSDSKSEAYLIHDQYYNYSVISMSIKGESTELAAIYYVIIVAIIVGISLCVQSIHSHSGHSDEGEHPLHGSYQPAVCNSAGSVFVPQDPFPSLSSFWDQHRRAWLQMVYAESMHIDGQS